MKTNINSRLVGWLRNLYALLDYLQDVLAQYPRKPRKTEHDADLQKHVRRIASEFEHGFSVNGNKFLSIKDTFENIIIYGITGTGKSTVLIQPSLLRAIGKASIILNDVSGEHGTAISGAFKAAGYRVLYLVWSDHRYGYYNPMSHVRTVSELRRLCALIIHTALGRSEPFWNSSAQSCLELFAQIVYAQAEEFRSFANVVHLLNVFSYKPALIDALVVSLNDPKLLAEYKAFVAAEPKTQANVLYTTKAALTVFSHEEAALVTSRNEIDFESMRSIPTILFIQCNVVDQKFFSLLTSVLFTQFFRHVLDSIAPPNLLPVYAIIDEAGSLDLSSVLATAMVTARKARVSIVQAYQSQSQLQAIFSEPDARTISENAKTKLYLPGIPINTATELSRQFGNFSFSDETGIHKRALFEPSELHELDSILAVYANKRAMLFPLKPVYKNPRFKHLLNLPPYRPQYDTINAVLPLIPL